MFPNSGLLKSEKSQKNKTILGIDEAGRGPVIGPMVMVGCLIRPQVRSVLEDKVSDSKKISDSKRDDLFDKIKEQPIPLDVSIISPKEIDRFGLSFASHGSLSDIMDSLGFFADEIISDEMTGVQSPFVEFQEKADQRYCSVSCASIVAKTIREREIQKIKNEIGSDFGSGYPSDSKTRTWLEENYSTNLDFVRHSWSTCDELS